MKDGDPLVLEDCETPRSAEEYRRIAEESLEEVLRLENASDWEPIPYADDRVSLAGLTLPDSPLKCVRTSTILPGSPKVRHVTLRKRGSTVMVTLTRSPPTASEKIYEL